MSTGSECSQGFEESKPMQGIQPDVASDVSGFPIVGPDLAQPALVGWLTVFEGLLLW